MSAAATARLYKLSSAQCIGSLQSRVYNIHDSTNWANKSDGDGKNADLAIGLYFSSSCYFENHFFSAL